MFEVLLTIVIVGAAIYMFINYINRTKSQGYNHNTAPYPTGEAEIKDLSSAEKILREGAVRLITFDYDSYNYEIKQNRYSSKQEHLAHINNIIKFQKSKMELSEVSRSLDELTREARIINLVRSVDAADNFNINRNTFKALQDISNVKLNQAFQTKKAQLIGQESVQLQEDGDKGSQPDIEPVINASIPLPSISNAVAQDATEISEAIVENEENRDINPLADINEAINTSETEASENIWVNIAGTEESAKSEAAEDIEATYIEEVKFGQKESTKISKNTTNILLLSLGTVFVLLAGMLFATTSWSIMPGIFKIGLILAVVALFFAGSVFTEKKLKLSAASKTLYILSSLFVFVAVISIAYFELFGSYFSLHNQSRYFVLLIGSLGTELALFRAIRKFNVRWYTDICLYIISICVSFFILSFNMMSGIFTTLYTTP